MKHRAEDLALEILDAIDLDQRSADEGAVLGAARRLSRRPFFSCASTYAEMSDCASASITGATSVSIDQGSPVTRVSIAPISISTTRSLVSSWT